MLVDAPSQVDLREALATTSKLISPVFACGVGAVSFASAAAPLAPFVGGTPVVIAAGVVGCAVGVYAGSKGHDPFGPVLPRY